MGVMKSLLNPPTSRLYVSRFGHGSSTSEQWFGFGATLSSRGKRREFEESGTRSLRAYSANTPLRSDAGIVGNSPNQRPGSVLVGRELLNGQIRQSRSWQKEGYQGMAAHGCGVSDLVKSGAFAKGT